MNRLQVDSPQNGHPTGVDGQLRESEPDGVTRVCTSSNSISLLTVTQPLSFEEEVEETYQMLLDILAVFESKRPNMDPDWYAGFCESIAPLFKFVEDSIRDGTLPNNNWA